MTQRQKGDVDHLSQRMKADPSVRVLRPMPEGMNREFVEVLKNATFDEAYADGAVNDLLAEANSARSQFVGVVVYLFGAIKLDPLYKRRFSEAQQYCERWGMTVLNPTRHPVDPNGRLREEYYMRQAMADIDACEFMVPVPSPFLASSAGAAAERAYATCVGRPILDGFIPWEG